MTDTPKTNDIVLMFTRVILILTKVLLKIGVGVVIFTAPILLLLSDTVTTSMADVFIKPPGNEIVWMIVGMMLLAAVIMLLSLFALNRLRKIVDSVGEGNPFTRINGTRLRGMGIAVLAIQIISAVGALLATGILNILGETKPGADFHLTIDGGISLTGTLLFLILIILARVFDRGAEMREELEGTV